MRTNKEIQLYLWDFYEEDIPTNSWKGQIIKRIEDLEIATASEMDLTELRNSIKKQEADFEMRIIQPIANDKEFIWD